MAQAAKANAQSFGHWLRDFSSKNAILLVLIGLVLITTAIKPKFFSLGNFINILMIASVYVVISLGEMPILLTKGVDLSAGRLVGLTACIAASLMQRPDYASKIFEGIPFLPVIVPIVLAVLIGMTVGMVNGLIVAFLKVPPLITTLGTMVIVYGITSLYVDRPPHGASPIGGLRDDYSAISVGNVFSFGGDIRLPTIIFIAAIVITIMWIVLNKTRFGKNIYAIGANPDAATVSGVSVPRTLIGVYVIAGALYALAGVLQSARQGSATNSLGFMWELDAIAACVIGGVSTNGGIGTVRGVVIGVLIMQVLSQALLWIDLPKWMGSAVYWQQIIKGLVIIVAVAIDIRKYLKKR